MFDRGPYADFDPEADFWTGSGPYHNILTPPRWEKEIVSYFSTHSSPKNGKCEFSPVFTAWFYKGIQGKSYVNGHHWVFADSHPDKIFKLTYLRAQKELKQNPRHS